MSICIYSTTPTSFAADPSAAAVDPCVKAGGKVNIVARLEKPSPDNPKTEERLCVFGKTMITEWTLQRELLHEKTMALNKLLDSTLPKNIAALKKAKPDFMNKETQATKNCRAHGGKILAVKDQWRDFNLCRFEDFSGINENAFFRGRGELSNVLLIKKLRMAKKH